MLNRVHFASEMCWSGGARQLASTRSPFGASPLKPLFSWESPFWFASRVSLREEEDADGEEDEEGKDDVRKEIWEVQHLALGTRSRQPLFLFC